MRNCEAAAAGSVPAGQSGEAVKRDGKPRKAVREVFLDSSSVLSFVSSFLKAAAVPVFAPCFLFLVLLSSLRFSVGGGADVLFKFFAVFLCVSAVSVFLHEMAHAACLASKDYAHDLSVRVYFMKICVVARREHSVKRLIIAAVAGPFAGSVSALLLGFAFNMLPIACFIAFFNLLALIPPADDGMRILEAAKTAKAAKPEKAAKA